MFSFFKHRPDVPPEGLCVCDRDREGARERVGGTKKRQYKK